MGRILFLLMTLTDLIPPHPLSLGNHGPLVRRKDLEKFRNSFSKKAAVSKPLLILHWPGRGCLGLPIITDSLFSSRDWGPGCRVELVRAFWLCHSGWEE